MSEASKPISVVSAFSRRSLRARIAASKLAKVCGSSNWRNGAVSPLANASTMVVKAARAPGEADRLEADRRRGSRRHRQARVGMHRRADAAGAVDRQRRRAVPLLPGRG
jgi:hypothetical protein